ncbi:MAG: DUF501 domain-containing protein [Actinomycetota bacterium]
MSVPPDAEAVRRVIGRAPLAGFSVSVRCPHGAPAVIANDPVDAEGRPFPTRHWLCCRALVDAVSRLEAGGGVRDLEGDPDFAGALAAAQAEHRRLHAGHNVGGVRDPSRVKCLHAHLAFALACGGSPVGDWILDRSGAAFPARCCVEVVG